MGSASAARGAFGESLAARWYERQGYEVLARNWRCTDGELDLVAAKGNVLVVCEVKARASDAYGSPLDAVTAAKQARLRRLAARYLREAAPPPPVGGRHVRFDVAAVTGARLSVVEGAF